MKGFVANTDFEWYRFLRERPALEEVNFWQPSGSRGFRAVEQGEPFFFKLKRPHYAIAGFGVFTRAQILPDWQAWECFGEGNGAADFQAMRERIQRYRASNQIAMEAVPRIGCLIVAEPIFFPDDLWVEQPRDWSPNVVSGATYDLTQGEGRRIFEECQQRAAALVLRQPSAPLRERVAEIAAYGRGVLVHPRLGQGTFRLAVQDAYGSACAVTGEHSLPALEAAHIRPYRLERRHEVINGLLLRGDLHKLFDKGYVGVTPDGVFRVSDRLRADFSNGRSYYPLNERPIHVPDDPAHQPDRDKLAWHMNNVFLS